MNITDCVVAVTGASSGLGRACANALVERGARVFGLARRSERLATLERQLGAAFTGISCDVTEPDAVNGAFSNILDGAGRLDVLINNAGLGRFGRVDEFPLAEWDLLMKTNLRGIFLCTRAVVPIMKKQNESTGFGVHIVNIASVAGLLGNPVIGAYNVTKFGVRGFSESLMKELRDDGIKVTCVYPGSIETEFFEVAEADMSPSPMKVEDVASTVVHVIDTPPNYLVSEVVMRPLRPRG
jgi:NADP-dependent 3-hydroxy acid dehydrogenase YdfG